MLSHVLFIYFFTVPLVKPAVLSEQNAEIIYFVIFAEHQMQLSLIIAQRRVPNTVSRC